MMPMQLENLNWTFDRDELSRTHQEFLDVQRRHAVYEVGGLRFDCPPGIYHPTEISSTRFVWRGLLSDLNRFGKTALEIGCGCGAIGVCLATTGRQVTLVDTDPLAVQCSVGNAARNQVGAEVMASDLFSSVTGQTYDLVVFNVPLFDKPIEDPVELMACDHNGRLFTRFITQSPQYLKVGGYVCFTVSNIGNRDAILCGLQDYICHIAYYECYPQSGIWRCLVVARIL
jgi:methylase of polypeptide subunit release factors